jgi:preprotein translocase subunit SecD
MLHFAPWKIWSIVGVTVLSILLAVPNFLPKRVLDSWPSWLPHRQLSLGLDLRGGAHLLLAMRSDDVRAAWLKGIRDEARRKVRDAKDAKGQPIATQGRPEISGKAVQVRVINPAETDVVARELRKMVQTVGGSVLGTGSPDLEIASDSNGLISITPREAALADRISNAISAAIETVRRRVDPTGTTEPVIVRQGRDRILVQVPGLTDTTELKQRVGETALLSFHLLHPSTYDTHTISAEEAKSRPAPAGFRYYPSEETEGQVYLLAEPAITGDQLTNATPAFDQQTNQPIISFTLNQEGARTFGRLTTEHVKRPFAIVLDDKVISSPVIQTPILGGSGQISGSFTVDSANRLAIQLRSGSLPAKLTVVEERTVGPSLGADSIEAGTLAGVIGLIATVIMTVTAYGTFGMFAVMALLVNGIMIVAIMSVMGATLTLPGIAGLVLTIGMAVDANVIIYERIREELRAGKTAIAAIETGFSRAFVTIWDSQLTTLAAALLMFWLGSGPIRGFAVTLTIGIFTSVFTAVTITRLLVVLWLKGARSRQRSIDVPI